MLSKNEEFDIKQCISWWHNSSDPGASSDYLVELLNLTTDQNYEFIITEIINFNEGVGLTLLDYLEDIATPERKNILIYLNQINTVVISAGLDPSFTKLILKLKGIYI